jgi:spermidine synthase
VIYLLVLLSGAAALIYEVVWGRQLATFLGITTYAHTIVLASFMSGLAIGAWALGRYADRVRRPLRLFAHLEAGIGLFGLLTLILVPALQKLYVAIAPATLAGWPAHGARLVIAGIAVLPAAVLMGGTLPVLVRGLHFHRRPLSRTVAGLYGINTLGAACGALASGYVLLPALGVRGSLLVAVGLNMAVAFGASTLRLQAPAGKGAEQTAEQGDSELSDGGHRLLLIGFAVSGAAALSLQIAWIRALTQIIGSSVYAFSLTTASYLIGLALGSLIAALVAERLARHGSTLATAAILETGVGFSVIAGIPLLARLPELFLTGYRLGIHESFPRLQIFAFFLASAVLVVPTALLGAVLPLLTSLAPRAKGMTGQGIGRALAANSVGTVVGTLLSGLLLLSVLGAEGLLRAAAVASVGAGGLLWIARSRSRPGIRKPIVILTGLIAFLALSVTIPHWDPALMTSGPFINAARFVDVPAGEQLRTWIRNRSRILYHQEGVEATVSVRDVSNERLLVINGKTDGSRHGDRKTQLALAHLPLLSHPDPQRVLLVGLGTGMSAAAAAAHGDIDHLEIIELSREVIEASHFFARENENVLQDPRVRLTSADARNFLLTARQPFDVILSEPSNPWISGVSNLFTREYFELARQRLAPGGIVAQWFQTYGMSGDDLRSVLRSFADSFPQVTVWSPQLGDLLFLGSLEPLKLSLPGFTALLHEPRGRDQLESIDLEEPADLARLFLLDNAGVRSFVAGASPNTDDRPRVEFNAPRSLYSETTVENLVSIIDPNQPSGSVFEALGLAIVASPGIEAAAEWRVNWTAFTGGGELPAPVGVGNRPTIVLAGPDSRIEIERGWSDSAVTTQFLLDHLRSRIEDEPEAIGRHTLSTGEAAVWLTSPGLSGPQAAMAWSCGSHDGRISRYLALVVETEEAPETVLNRLARIAGCSIGGSEDETAVDSNDVRSRPD